jgi:hypothetical protein
MLPRPLKYLFFLAVFLLCILFIILQFYIPKKLTDYLNQNPDWQGYNLKINKINYSLLSGFNFQDIEISKPVSKEKYIKIDDLKLNIDFLNSILKKKAVIERVQIDNIESGISKEFLNEISNLKPSGKTQELQDKQQTNFELEELEIDNFDIIYEQQYGLSLNNLMFRLGDFENLDKIYFHSNIKIFEKDFLLKSKVNRSNSAISASVDLHTPSLEILDSDKLQIPDLQIQSMIKIDIKDEIISRAVVTINQNEDQVGKADVNLNFNKKDSTLFINETILEIFELISLKTNGKVIDTSNNPKIEVVAEIENLNLERITHFFSDQYGTQLSGKIVKNYFELTGSIKDNLNLKGQVIFDDFLLKHGKGDLVIDGLTLGIGVLFNPNKNINNLGISARSNKFAGGNFALVSEADFNKDTDIFNGSLKARNLDLSKLDYFKDIAQGNILNLNTKFNGNTDRIELFSDLSAKNISIKLSDTQNLYISDLTSSEKIYNIINLNKLSDEKNNFPANNIDIKLNNLAYKKLDYNSFKIEKGLFNAEASNIFNKEIKFDLSLNGDSLNNGIFNLNLDKVEISAKADKSKRESITGNILSSSGKYNDFGISNLKSDFDYDNSGLKLSEINFSLKEQGKANIREINLPFEKEKTFPSKINLLRGNFISSENGFNLKGINLDLNNKINDVWDGKINIDEADLVSVKLRNLNSLVSYSSRGFRTNRIRGDLFEGKLTGFLNSQNNNLKLNFDLLNPKIPSKENFLIAEKLKLIYEGKFESDYSLPTGTGEFIINNLYVEDYEEESKLNFILDIESENETLSLKNGLINNSNNDVLLSFSSEIEQPFSKKRKLGYKTNKVNLVEIKKFLNPYLPPFIRFGEITGDMNVRLSASNFPEDSTILGFIDFNNISIKGDPFGTYFNLENLDGRLDLSKSAREPGGINEVIGRHTKSYRQAYKYAKNISIGDDSNVNIKRLDYGFFTLENIRLLMNIVKNKLTIKELSTNIFGGKLSSSGFYNFGNNKRKAGMFYFLFNDISLKNITDSVPGTEGYISGRFNGIVSLVQKERRTNMLDGLFNFWTVGSRKEKRIVGKAFLERLGARERFLLGSSKNYDKGALHGYINKGVITFNEMQISNSFLGLKDLNIKVHNRRNSISVAHLLSVIKETARRANTGSLDFQFQN